MIFIDIILKNDARLALLILMRLLGINIESQSTGDLFIMSTSGFVMSHRVVLFRRLVFRIILN
jgi:hypothetical protein